MSDYTVRDHAAMIHDARRVEAYQRALQLAVGPDSVVVDLGTGLGIFAFLACQAGARKVYSIEPSGVIAVARELAATNGFLERIEFIEDLSTQVTLPEQADVIVSDIGGASPLFRRHLPSIIDARKRLLKPGGTLIPRQDTLWAAVAEAPEVHRKIAPPIVESLGLDMRRAWEMAANAYSKLRVTEAQLVTGPERVAILNYSEIEDSNLHSLVKWSVTRRGLAHGIHLWFDRILADGVCYSTGPHEPEMVYGALFFPWPEPVELQEGDSVELELRADLQSDDYLWSWNSRISRADSVKYTFRQSEFLAEARSLAEFRKQSAAYVPALNEAGEMERLVLHLMDGKNAVEDIAREVQRQFPSRFPTLKLAIGYVGERARAYSL